MAYWDSVITQCSYFAYLDSGESFVTSLLIILRKLFGKDFYLEDMHSVK